MFTFSQMVDDIVSEVKRQDLISDMSRYLNQTIRECHFDPETNASLFFIDNLREARLTTTADSSHTWTIKNPTTFQKMAAVKLGSVMTYDDSEIWLTETTPGRHLQKLSHYYYRVGQTFVFSGVGKAGSIIDIAWFAFPISLPYFRPDCRPMIYNGFNGKEYAEGWTCDEDRLEADAISTNWLLERWNTVVSEGLRAKAYKRVSDTERARTSYSLYSQLRRGLCTSEISRI